MSELGESYRSTAGELESAAYAAGGAKKLWCAGNKSRLVKIGVALIVFPEPTGISDCLGACFVAAGAVQQGIQKRAIFLEDLAKTFKNTLKDVSAAKDYL